MGLAARGPRARRGLTGEPPFFQLLSKIPRSRRWRVSLAGRRTMSTAIKLREVAYPALFAAAA